MRRHWPELLALVAACAVVLSGLNTPLVEDGLFWWVPKALLVAEQGPAWVLDTLPQAALPQQPLPPQWADGLPDYAHPPGWYVYLGAWLWALGPTHTAVHLATLPLAALFGLGLARLLRRLGGTGATAGAWVLVLLPPVAAQLLRADTDLPLMALTPWALLAVIDRRDAAFALTAGLATACKEPGVLLAAPALLACVLDRRPGWGWMWPLLVLGAWAGVHHAETGWALAGSERLPETVGGWARDLGAVLSLVLLEQGRWLLLPLAAWALVKDRLKDPRAALLLSAHLVVQLGFFGTLNYLGGLDRVDAHTHVRYLIPALLTSGLLLASLAPRGLWALLLANLWFLHRPSPRGPEASLYGLDLGRVVQRSAPLLADLERPLWVGSYAWTQLTRPYAGVVTAPVPELQVYGYGTDPEQVDGHVVELADGEPLGRLQELDLELVQEQRVRHAWLRVYRVLPP